VDVYADMNSLGYTGGDIPDAEAAGWVTFYVQPENIIPPPFTPADLPIYFEASGHGSTTSGTAYLQLISDFGNYLSTHGEPFDLNTTKWTRAGDLLYIYLNASCSARQAGGYDLSNWPPTPTSASAHCEAAIDPTIHFDQAAFDAKYGANSFTLTDYYRLHFSDNIVPVPAAVWLFGSGLLGLIAVARRKKG
jgi:hypothetical protein